MNENPLENKILKRRPARLPKGMDSKNLSAYELKRDSLEKDFFRARDLISSRINSMQMEETRDLDQWEFYFDMRDSDGLFEILENRGVSVVRNDGKVTLKKKE
jgi:hypothetical protein